jgi:hypothetical protein
VRYTRQYHDALVALWKWHKSFRGAGVRNTQSGVIFSPPTSARRVVSDAQPTLVPILLTGAAPGGGWYIGNVLTNPAPSDPTTTLQQYAFGTVPSGAPTVYIANPAEVGLSSHQLAAAGYLPLVFYCRQIANTISSSGSSSGSPASGPAAYAIVYGEQPNFCPPPTTSSSGSSS